MTLARAVYSSAEILLLDDVLAALDVHTSRWIVEKCFQGDLLKDRTVILVVGIRCIVVSSTDVNVLLDPQRRHGQPFGIIRRINW